MRAGTPRLLARHGFVAAAAMVFAAAAAQAETRVDIQRMIIEEALNSQVPPALALAVARVESDFDASAESSVGARGVMQIMPATARGEYGVGADELWDARLNIQLGIDFLEQLYVRYGSWDLALSHYNAGSVQGTGQQARILPVTRRYVENVRKWRERYTEYAAIWQPDVLRPGWTPARTRPAFAEETPRTETATAVARLAAEVERRERTIAASAAVRQIAAEQRAVVRARRTRVERSRVDAGPLDDFGPDLAERRTRARDRLDDFAALANRSDG